MAQFPIYFDAVVGAGPGIKSEWHSSSGNFNRVIQNAIPKEFDGPGGGFAPEDLFAMSLANCYAALFKVYAEKADLDFQHLDVDVHLTVDRNQEGHPWMSMAEFAVNIYRPDSEEKALELLEKASRNCMVLNSIKTEKTFDFTISKKDYFAEVSNMEDANMP